jgi:hypothetical protein
MSITNVYYQPKIWSPAYNPIVWSFLSNQNTQTDFNYVVDLYINGATGATYRIKQRPNQVGVGMIDVSTALQGYVELTDWSAEEGWSLAYRNSDEILANVYIKVGEEYNVNGTQTIFNGSGVTGAPAYTIYAQGYSKPVRVLPAALPYNEAMENMSATGNFGYFLDYIMDGDGKFLKRAGNNISVLTSNRYTLSFLNWNDTAPSYAAGVQLAQITEYSATGANLGSFVIQNTTTNGGGPQTVDTYTSLTESRATDMLTFRCGPKDLENALGGTTAYYTVQLFKKASATSSTTPGVAASEIVTFTFNTQCQNLYPDVQLSWLNDLGGRDYYNFTKFYEKVTNSPDTPYFQTPLNWNSTIPISLNGSADTTQNWQRGGNKSFNKVVNTTFNVQTDWVLQEDMDLLGGIPESPSVWCYIGDDATPYTVEVRSIDYVYRNIEQVKLAQATLELAYTKVQPKQNM